MTAHAIETRYGGCLFRSRLEARWAVFFDHLGIAWEYEPEGFELNDGRRYLPDFRIQTAWHHVGAGSTFTYVEVKGADDQVTPKQRQLIGSLIDFQSSPLSTHGLLLLGAIPDVRDISEVVHCHLYWREGVQSHPVKFHSCSPGTWKLCPSMWVPWFFADGATDDIPPAATWAATTLSVTLPSRQEWFALEDPLRRAYEAARSARFEFGFSGATPNSRPTIPRGHHQ